MKKNFHPFWKHNFLYNIYNLKLYININFLFKLQMERKPPQKKEVLLPTSLMEDIECDELDKELQLIQINENNEPKIKSIYILFYFLHLII